VRPPQVWICEGLARLNTLKYSMRASNLKRSPNRNHFDRIGTYEGMIPREESSATERDFIYVTTQTLTREQPTQNA